MRASPTDYAEATRLASGMVPIIAGRDGAGFGRNMMHREMAKYIQPIGGGDRNPAMALRYMALRADIAELEILTSGVLQYHLVAQKILLQNVTCNFPKLKG
jgi:hypothetical protein